MKFPIITILICFVMFAVVGLSFVFLGSPIVVNSIEGVKGTVLGMSEEIKDISLSHLPGALYTQEKLLESKNKPEEEKKPKIIQFNLESNCATVMDLQSKEIFFEKESLKQWPIASITKLVTALVFLEYNPGWNTIYEVRREDRREGGKIYLYTGDKVSVKDLFYLSLVGSANTAAIALVHSTGMNEIEFVQKMNEKVNAMGLKNTQFFDPVGLSYNVSTAKEIAEFAQVALTDPDISEATLTKKYELVTSNGRKRIIYNTDDLLNIFPQNGIRIMGGKTGYTVAAGYCFVGKFIDHDGREMISVVLGSGDRNSRFSETKNLAEWAYENYIW